MDDFEREIVLRTYDLSDDKLRLGAGARLSASNDVTGIVGNYAGCITKEGKALITCSSFPAAQPSPNRNPVRKA
jgi:hypothetical protein